MENLTGKQLGPYQIVDPLGEGGMAAVYKAHQPSMDRYVALKILPRHFASDPEFTARFEQEAKILAKLQHPHILPVFDYGQSDSYSYIAMPFLQSGTLANLLKGTPLPLSQILRIITQVGDALDYAHTNGLVHRDVKPSNVLLDGRGNCLLTDFGIAKIIENAPSITATGGLIGTPAYMSPEQGLGYKVDRRSDLYALGVILYEMATGRVPYKAETPMAVVFKHVNDPLPLPRQLNPTLPEAVERIILRALAKRPEDRYAAADSMVQALQAAIPASVINTTALSDEVTILTSSPVSVSTQHKPTNPETPPPLTSVSVQEATEPSPHPSDLLDEIIRTELSQREWMIYVAETAVYYLTIVNGGEMTATFEVKVQGLNENWLTLSPSRIHLQPHQRTTASISITVPRLPTSLAKAYRFAVAVTSPSYPNRSSQHSAILTLKPYYQFHMNDLSPKWQTIAWFKRSAQFTVGITNEGNSDATFLLEGEDEERACRVEFYPPAEKVSQVRQEAKLLKLLPKFSPLATIHKVTGSGFAKQVELHLSPNETVDVSVQVTPRHRSLIGLRVRSYELIFTTRLLEASQTPHSLLGQLKTKPLFGPLPLALLSLLLLLLILYMFWPTIYLFTGEPKMIRAGEEVKLRWWASTFTKLRIDNGVGPLEGTVGEVIVAPKNTTTYKLNGDNWLSALIPSWFGDSKEVTVEVKPVKPIIRVFSADKEGIINGEEVTLSWEVVDADELMLITNGNPETLLSTEHTSQRVTKPNVDTIYTLEARNIYGEVTDSVEVKVLIPTATPIPTPAVIFFAANPASINEGERSTLSWEVVGVQQVTIQGIPGGSIYPAQGNIVVQPTGSANYILGVLGAPPQVARVEVFPATPTPAPMATPVPNALYCSDFSSWAEAQAIFLAAGGPAKDLYELDPDRNGIACDELKK